MMPKDMMDDLMESALYHNCERFMRQSNWIEGERDSQDHTMGRLYENDVAVCMAVYQRAKLGKYPKWQFLKHHERLAKNRLDMECKGEWRNMQVYVGDYTPPAPEKVSDLMEDYFQKLNGMDAWTAHNEFQKIHPFEDLNGRMGRLLWLYAMVRADRDPFQLPFLHLYYYQTLQHYER